MQDKLFLDTNILVYLANESDEWHEAVREKFYKLAAFYTFCISRQVIREYAVIMTRPGIVEQPLTPDEVAADIEKWKLICDIADETEEVTDHLMSLLKKYQLKGKRIHDANIVATMLAYSIPSIFTMNETDFKKFEEITIVALMDTQDETGETERKMEAGPFNKLKTDDTNDTDLH